MYLVFHLKCHGARKPQTALWLWCNYYQKKWEEGLVPNVGNSKASTDHDLNLNQENQRNVLNTYNLSDRQLELKMVGDVLGLRKFKCAFGGESLVPVVKHSVNMILPLWVILALLLGTSSSIRSRMLKMPDDLSTSLIYFLTNSLSVLFRAISLSLALDALMNQIDLAPYKRLATVHLSHSYSFLALMCAILHFWHPRVAWGQILQI